jgi:tetratricopeptide (TPR) repeat protein
VRAHEHARKRLESVTASVQRIDALQTLGQIELLTGQLTSAREHLEQSMRLAQVEGSPRKYLWSAIVLSWLDLRYRDRPDDARRRIERALTASSPQRASAADIPVLELATLYSALGMGAQARQLRGIESMRIGGAHLTGMIAAAEGRWRDAAILLREASSAAQECSICVLPALAEAEEQSGNIDAAIEAADRYVRTPFIHRFEIDAPHLATNLLRLARLYERRNEPARAIAAYERLLDTWRKSGSELAPQVSALRTRVALLKQKQ